MASPDILGASARYIEIDLGTTAPPFLFRPLFAAEWPEDRTFDAQAVSRTIQVVAGSGSLEVRDTTNKTRTLTFGLGEVNAIQVVGIESAVGVSRIKVYL